MTARKLSNLHTPKFEERSVGFAVRLQTWTPHSSALRVLPSGHHENVAKSNRRISQFFDWVGEIPNYATYSADTIPAGLAAASCSVPLTQSETSVGRILISMK